MSAKMKWDNIRKKTGERIDISISQIARKDYIRALDYKNRKDYNDLSTYRSPNIRENIVDLTHPQIKNPNNINKIYEKDNKIILEDEFSNIKTIYIINKEQIKSTTLARGYIYLFKNIGYCLILEKIYENIYNVKYNDKILSIKYVTVPEIINHIEKHIPLRNHHIDIDKICVKNISIYNKRINIECDEYFVEKDNAFVKYYFSISSHIVPEINKNISLKRGDIIYINSNNKLQVPYGVITSRITTTKKNYVEEYHLHTCNGLYILYLNKNRNAYTYTIKKYFIKLTTRKIFKNIKK